MRENWLAPADLIYPLFVVHGRDVKREIASMPGNYHWSVDRLPAEAEEIARLGIPAVILFGLPAEKDPIGTENFDSEGIVQQAVRTIKDAVPELFVITDVCMCEYTDHGHCGVMRGRPTHCHGKGLPGNGSLGGCLDNDTTLEILSKVSLSHAEAGVDMVAPSDMMDGRVGAIRAALDAAHYDCVGIMSYAAKYASAFYGPFRDAADSPPQFGDRSGYQMDPANAREALREVALDVAEGADVVMVKPALPYLDILRQVRDRFDLPTAAYNVSGEFSMVKAAALRGWLDEKRAAMEALTSIKRAGADIIITYWAKDVARWLDTS
jgi:porphobilinogen synthase